MARWSYLALLAARRRISVLARSYYYTGNAVQCPFCKGRFRRFLPTGVLDREFWQSEEGRATLSLDFVTVCNQQCPRCGSSERHRLAYFFLKDKIDS